jgi:tripartite-type tricarboxylate transporter receptor subunit TctC
MVSRRGVLAVVALAALAGLPAAQAQGSGNYPEKPVTLVVPYAAGGGADTISRLMAQALGQAMGQPIVVQNKPGGATNIANMAVARAAPDGYTLMLVTIAFSANQGLFANPGYKPSEFAPVAQLATIPGVLTVGATDAAPPTFAELVKQVRGNPGKVAFATTGIGAGPSLACELMRSEGDLPYLHVPYPGSAKLMTDLLGGQVPAACDTVTVQLPFIRQGKVKALAVLGPARSALLPNVPSIAELGFKGAAADGWVGIVAPAGTPAAIVERLNKELRLIVQRPDTHNKLAELGFEPRTGSAQEFRSWIDGETERWVQLAKVAGLKAE